MAKTDFAPQDPTKKGSYFYIMMDKDILGAPQPEGGFIQFIFQDDNRMINAAKIAGGVDDETILEKLKTTAGFREVVDAIGVSVFEKKGKAKVKFVYQMYGNTDKYVSGTSIEKEFAANGIEEVIKLDSVNWSGDDNCPGQIRFEFNEKTQASATVRFYLKDGYEVDPPEVDVAVDENSPEYKLMILRSQLSTGNTARIQKAIKRAQSGEDVTLAYIGGSITQGAGAIPINTNSYAYKSFVSFRDLYGKGNNVHFVKAGVGGTPSELGMVRFERDVLRDGKVCPDVIVIEFAVNDYDDETEGECFESLVRKCLALPNKPAVILLFAVFANDSNLQERLIPIGKKYELPMISLKDAVTDQFKLKSGMGRVLSKNQFFYDIYHPSNLGHTIMSDCLSYLFKEVSHQAQMEDHNTLKEKPVYGKSFEAVKLIDRITIPNGITIDEGSFDKKDTVLQCVEMDDVLDKVPQFPNNWLFDGSSYAKDFEMTLECSKLLIVIKDEGNIEFGAVDISIDGKVVRSLNALDVGWCHCNAKIVLCEDEAKLHKVKVSMAEGNTEKKFTILGWAYDV